MQDASKVTMKDDWQLLSELINRKQSCCPTAELPVSDPGPDQCTRAPPPRRDKGRRARETLTLITFCQFNYIAWFIASASLLRPALIIETQTKDVLSAFARHGAGPCRHIWLVCVIGQGQNVFVFARVQQIIFFMFHPFFFLNLNLYNYNLICDWTLKPFLDGVDEQRLQQAMRLLRLLREGQLSCSFSDELSGTLLLTPP